VMVTTILVEFLPSGSLLVTPRFDTLNLFSDIGGILSIKALCQIVFYIFIFYFITKQIIEIFNIGLKSYFREFWNLIEFSIILTALVSFVMTILRLKAANDVLNFFKTTGGYGYIKLQKVNEYNQILTSCLGLCSSIGTIKLLKMLRFNQNISILGVTLKECFQELVSFSFVFFIIWISFVQIMFLIFNQNLEGYLSMTKSMASALEIMIGKLSATQFVQSNPILGPIILSSYCSAVIFFSLNIFISIIVESFDKVRMEAKKDPEKFGFLNHLLNKFKKIFKKKAKGTAYCDYKSHFDILPKQVDHLIDIVFKVLENF
jgi:hypothetical protein